MNERSWHFPTLDKCLNQVAIQKALAGDEFYENSSIAAILSRRGITDNLAAQAFFEPEIYQPSSASEFPDIEKAVARIVQAISTHEKICIWGDFDVDGQTSTAVLVQGLEHLGASVTFHIPDRAKDSHGVFIPGLINQIEKGTSLVITCDTGITAVEPIQFANQAGVQTIVTDHHELPANLPPAYAIINPHLLKKGHPLSTLPGVGVAYKLIEALYERYGLESETEQFLDLVAIGIIADVAVLSKDTRYLAQRGLTLLRNTQRVGLQQMIELAEINPEGINEEIIGFSIGPRLNALGRLGDANRAVEFLTTNNKNSARIIALELEALNVQRQILTEDVFQNAILQISQDPTLDKYAAIVLSGKSWPVGIIGIVASRLVNRFNKPVILFSSPENSPARGSARSVTGINIVEVISDQIELLLGFGGHSMAAGLSIAPENISKFRESISTAISSQISGSQDPAGLQIDAVINFPELNLDFANFIEKVAPFGSGNPKIIFAAKNLRINKKQIIGRRKDHLVIHVADQTGFSQKILFWQGANADLPEETFDLAYTIRKTTYQGQPELQVEWVEARHNEEEKSPLFKISRVKLTDYREDPFPVGRLNALKKENPDLEVWAEAVEGDQLGSKNRLELLPAKVLAIFTIPPDRATLNSILERTKPEVVWVFALDPGMDNPQNLLKRLFGLLKFLANRNQFSVNLSQLASGCAQTTGVIRHALNYLAGRKLLEFQTYKDNELEFQIINQGKTAENDPLLTALTKALKETSAFRKYYRETPLSKVINPKLVP